MVRRNFLRRRAVAGGRLLSILLRRLISLRRGRLVLAIGGWLAVFTRRRRTVSLGRGLLGLREYAACDQEEEHWNQKLFHKSSKHEHPVSTTVRRHRVLREI